MNSTNVMRKIAAIDLDRIKVKLMHKESGEGWTAARADAIEVEYRRFLCLLQLYPQEAFAPLVDVDIFWHYHILDTRKYAADCQHAFGHFVHHNPHVGLGEDDAGDHLAFGERMHALYLATFGEACLSGAPAWCSLVGGAATQASAWCSLVRQPAAQSTAQGAASSNAWCSALSKPVAAAWCSALSRPIGTAWCSATSKPIGTAWCSVTAASASVEIGADSANSAERSAVLAA